MSILPVDDKIFNYNPTTQEYEITFYARLSFPMNQLISNKDCLMQDLKNMEQVISQMSNDIVKKFKRLEKLHAKA